MAEIVVPGSLSGRRYGFKIAGDAPTADEQRMIDTYVRQDEAQFAKDYTTRYGAPVPGAEGSGFLDYLGEIPKGILRGGVGFGQQAALGAAALLPEGVETPVREGILGASRYLQSGLQPDIGFEGRPVAEGVGTLSEGLGSFGALAATSLLPGGAFLAPGLAVGAGAGEASERARAAGATVEERGTAALFGAPVGALELVPLKRLERVLGAEFTGTVLSRIRRIAAQGGVEGAQEAAAEIAQNLIAQNIYNPEQGTFTGTGESFGYGAGVGGIVQGLLDLAIGRRARGGAGTPAPAETPVAPEQGELFDDLPTQARPAALREGQVQGELFPAAETTAVTPSAVPDEQMAFNFDRAEPDQLDLFAEPTVVQPRAQVVAPEPAAVETPSDYEAILDELGVPRTAAVRKAVKSGAVKTEDAFRERLAKFASATTSERAASVNEYLQRQAAPAVVPEAPAVETPPITEITDAETAPSGPVESDERGSGDGFERGSEQPSAEPVAGEPDTAPAATPDLGPVGGAVLGAPEPSVAEGPQPDALIAEPEAPAAPRAPVDEAAYAQQVREARARGFTTPAETLLEADEIAARQATLAEPPAAPMPEPQGPMTGQLPGVTTGAAGQVIPEAVPEAPRFTPEGAAVDPDIARAIAAQEAQDKVVAQDAITAWHETNASDLLRSALRAMGLPVTASPLPAADMQKVAQLLRKAPKQGKGKITPERAAFVYFSKSPDTDFALRSIAYDHAQVMETDADMREPDFRRADQFDDPAEAAFFEGTGVTPATRAAQWVRDNMSEQTRKLLAQYTFNDYRPIDYAAESSKRDVRSARQKELQAELDKFIADMGPATATPRASFSMAGVMSWPNRSHPRVEALIRAGDVAGALRSLSATAASRHLRQLADRLLARIGNARSQVVAPEVMDRIRNRFSPETPTLGIETPAGVYVHPRNAQQLDAMRREGHNEAADLAETYGGQILFNEASPLAPELVLHEAVHRVADGVLSNPSHPLTRQLDKLRVNLLKFMPATEYGLLNVRELLTEGMTNPAFRRNLSYVNTEGKDYSAWQEFKHIMRNFLRSIMGQPPKKRDTAADAVDRALNAVLAMNPNEMQSGGIVGASFAPGGARDALRRATERVRVPTKADLEQTRAVLGDVRIPSGWKDTLMRLAMPLDYVADAASKYLPSAKGVHDAILQHQAEIQRTSSLVMETTETIAKDLSKYRKNQDVIDNFNRVLFQGTLNEVDARKPRSAYEGYSFRHSVLDADGNVTRTVESKRYKTETERNRALIDFNSKLPQNAPTAARARRSFDQDPEQLQDYDRLRARYDTLPPEVKSAVGRSFEMPVALGKELTEAIRARLEALLPNQKAMQDKVYGIIYEKILAGQLIDPYQPLRRTGEYWLSYEAIDPETGRNEVFKHSFDSEGQRSAALRMLKAAPADQQIRNVDAYQNVGSMKARARVPMEFVARVLDTIDGSQDLAADVKGQVIELMFDTLPETSFVNSFRKRAGRRGFIADFTPITEGLTAGDTLKNLRESSMRIGRQTADLKYGAKFSALRTQLEREYNEFQGQPTPGLSPNQIARQRAEAAQYHDLLSDYTTVPFKQRAGWSRSLTAGTYMLTLGFNVSTALITMSQVPLFVAPFLSGRYGMRGTVGAIGEANRVLTSTGRERTVQRVGEDGKIETLRTPVQIWDYSVDNLDFSDPANAYLAPLHEIAKKNGVFNRSLLQDELLGEQPTMMQRIAAATGVMQHHAERYSRETALLAAYHLDLQARMGNTDAFGDFVAKIKSGELTPTAEQGRAAAEAAVNTSEKTNGPIYAATGPMASQNDIGAILYLFKRHPLSMLNLVGQTMVRANPFGTADAADRKIAQRQFAGMMGMMSLMAGTMGLPLMQQIGWLYDSLFADDDEPDFETLVRTTLGEAGSYGLVDYLTGTRISERIGLGGAIYRPGFAADQLPLPYQVLEGVGGPVLGLGLKYFDRVPTLLNDGEYQRALEAVLPSAFGNAARAVRFGDEGIRTMRYDPIIDDIGPFSVAAQALGFMPAQYAQQLAMNTVGTRINNAIDTKRTKLLRQRYVSMRKGDFARVQEINAEIREFNQKHPYNAITADTLRDSLTSHQRTTARTHHGIAYSPRNEAFIKSITEQFGPSSIYE